MRDADPEVLVVAPCGFGLRSGPSVFDTPEILAEILHEGAFPPRHEGHAWARWRQEA